MTAAPTVVICPDCDGMTFTLDPCACTAYGDRFFADADADADGSAAAGSDVPAPRREAYRGCEQCRGVGSVAYPCHRCGRRGRRRAQLVVTVANLDTGAVASQRVVPGGLDARRDPAGRWVVDLASRVRELATSVGAVVPATDVPTLWLDGQWRPDLPAARRYELEAHAILRADHAPWRLLLGRTTAAPPVDPAARLARLCALADLLLLDLVVEARRQGAGFGWAIRYEVPGTPVPSGSPGRCHGLPEALTRTDEAAALTGLAERGLAAPARLLRPGSPRPPVAPAVDVDQLERRILGDCVDPTGGDELPGAQALWRDGRWWHTTLRAGEPVDDLAERPTGQVVRRVRVPLTRGHQPPDPPWLGEPVGWRPCPDCRPHNRLRVCTCRLGGRPAEPDCPHCCGAGLRPSALRCLTCGDTHRLHEALLVTVTDLRHRVVHLVWRAGTPEDAPLVAIQPGGRPVVRLPDRYRLGAWAAVLGGRPEDLADADGGHELGKGLRDGYVTLPRAGADPVAEHVRDAGWGVAAGRLIVTTAPPDAPPLPELLRLTLGLDLALVVGMHDLRHHAADPLLADGLSWSVDVRPRDAPVHPDDLPCRPSLEAALAWCWELLPDTVAGAAPADPAAPIPQPRSGPRDLDPDPVPHLLRLAARHAGQVVTVRFTRTGCTVHRHDDDGVRLLAEALDLPAALAALRQT
ncbi:hypothetical protein GA0070616_3937 [Micromonospora nigra]|uniref:Uncharacterized protein n=1 Tax=Micromonospora nigra TaxID=145857 RepID=A0A1C6SJH7_9ACTN|nr:hypothetical protein [Micromonospora nigra]SCL29720.1 hypothetical protein GA0070616_3937 [Micromonospora nigra]